jgi:hypothetical protein
MNLIPIHGRLLCVHLTDLSSARPHVDVDDPSVRSFRSQPLCLFQSKCIQFEYSIENRETFFYLEDVVEVLGEYAGRETLVDAVVDGRSLVHILALEHVENVSETFAHDHRRRRHQTRDDGRLDEEAAGRSVMTLPPRDSASLMVTAIKSTAG